MTPLKVTAQRLAKRIEALTALRLRFGVDGMDNYQRAVLSAELKAVGIGPNSVTYITDMSEVIKDGTDETSV